MTTENKKMNLEQEKENLYQIQKQLELYTITVDALTSVDDPYSKKLTQDLLDNQHEVFQNMINTIDIVINNISNYEENSK